MKATTNQHQHQHQPKLTSIYWDIDDVAINTAPTMVDIINKHYNIPHNLPTKTVHDVKDWYMTSIYRDLKKDELEDLFKSEEFWTNIQVRPEFISIFSSNPRILSKYKHNFITKGTITNLERKRDFLSANFPHFEQFEYIGLLPEVSKSTIDMSDAIMIDDNIKNLIECNAAVKILLTNGLQTEYNNAFGDYANKDISEIYIVSTLEEVQQILEFNLECNLVTLK